MAGPSRFTPEQLEKIRSTLKGSLGDDSAGVLQNIEKRFGDTGEPTLSMEELTDEDTIAEQRGNVAASLNKVNVPRLIQEGNVDKMVEVLPAALSDAQGLRMLVANIIKLGKAYQMVDAMSKVKHNKELVGALVDGVVSKSGLNPVIDALRYASESPESMRKLAIAVAEQGTITHIIRAIATVHNNPEVEMIWATEIIGKGNVENMLDALNLINKASMGAVILATGVISTKEATLEQMVRAITICKDNPKAATIVAVELAKRADGNALVSILEKYVSDDSEAGEVVVAKLIQKGQLRQLVDACKHISTPSQAGRMLAAGIIQKKADFDSLMRAYKLLNSNPQAKKMVGLEIVKQKGSLMAFKALGSEAFNLNKNQEELDTFTKKAIKRYEWLLNNELKEEGAAAPAQPARK